MKELEAERRLDERRETCLSATFAEVTIARKVTKVQRLDVGVNRCQCSYF